MRNDPSTNIIRRTYLSMLPVQALSVGLPAINTLISSFIIGNRLGQDALAAIGFTTPFQNCIAIVSTTLAMGSQLLCGNHLGRGEDDGVRRTFSTTIALCVFFGLIFTAVSAMLPTQIAVILGAEGELISLTADYIRGQAPGIIFIIFSACMLPFLLLDHARMVSTAAVAAMVAVNIGGNMLNVFVLHWGIYGAGLSIAVSNIVSVLIGLVYFKFRSTHFRFSPGRISPAVSARIFRLGAPTAVSSVCGMFRDRIFNQVVFDLGGTVAMSAAAVATNLSNSVGRTIQGGYVGSANLLSSVLVGERDVQSLRQLPKELVKGILPVFYSVYAFLFIFAGPIALMFGAEPEHLAIYIWAIRLFNLYYLTNMLKNPSLSIYRAMGLVGTVSFFYVITDFMGPTFCCLVLTRFFGVKAAFCFPIFTELLIVCVYILYFTLHAHRLPRSIFEITYIPRTIGVPKADSISKTVSTLSEVSAASAEAKDFCLGKGLPPERASDCALAVETLAGDAIKYNFPSGKPGRYTVDVRIMYARGEVSVLLRDNGIRFDPNEWLSMHSSDCPERSAGLSAVSRACGGISYNTVLGLNVNTVTIR